MKSPPLASTFDQASLASSLDAGRPRIPPAPPKPLTLVDEIAVLREVLAMLDTLTAPGQRQTMTKIAEFIRQQASKGHGWLEEGASRELLELAAALGRDGQMSLPDVGAFTRRANEALARLAAAGADRPGKR